MNDSLPPSRRGAVPGFMTMEVFAEANAMARAGHDIIHLSLGQPGVEAPPQVMARVAEALGKERLGYTDPAGLPALRARIARHYLDRYGVSVSPSRIFITIGSSSAFQLALLAAFDAGQHIAIAAPCYPAYPTMMQALGLVPEMLPADEASRFQPTPAMLDALPEPPKGLVLASPSNPAGTVLHEDEMKALVAYAAEKKIRLLVDEIYHGITYGRDCPTILAHTDQAILVNSFSKYFLMPGWRLGWAVVPENLVASFEALMQSFYISPSAIAQYAALEVFECEEALKQVVASYARNRAVMLKALPEAGFTRLAPAEGAFFIYADVGNLTDDSTAFCRDMLHETGVVAVPGVDFDRARGKRFVRFSFSNSEENIAEAMRRLVEWTKKRRAA